VYSGGAGTAGVPYTISTVGDWQELTATSADWGKQFVLTADLDFAGAALTPVGNDPENFAGVLDGAGHTLSHFVINQPDSAGVGLFGLVGTGGQVRNLGVANATVMGLYSVGALAGGSYGAITSCYATGTVIGNGSYAGGLMGTNHGTISSCYATAAVSGIFCVGGLVGYNDHTVLSCYATGTVSGANFVGGLCGYGDPSNISGSFWDTQTSGQTTSAGGTGKTTAEMKTLATFTAAGWDFGLVWLMPLGDYPRLACERPAYSGGSGTAEDPYRIGCVADWQLLIIRPGDWGKRFILTADLDFGGMTITPVAPDTIPNVAVIRFDGPAFTGVLDGAGHTLSNLKIYQPDTDYIGLFGQVRGGQVKDLGLVNAVIRGNFFVGGLVGENRGTIISCTTAGTVSGRQYVGGVVGHNQGAITSCSATATVRGSGDEVGGLVGKNFYGTITSCRATGIVSGNSYVGGLVGDNSNGPITFCYATGPVSGISSSVGGLAGFSDTGTINSCYATGAVSGAKWVGGLVGYLYSGTITSCYAAGAVMGSTEIGGLCGINSGTISGCFWDILTSWQTISAGGTGKTTAQMKRQSTFTEAGWDFENVWGIVENESYPTLRAFWQPASADLNGDGRVDLSDFALFAEQWMM
jgi:hypothetical protein